MAKKAIHVTKVVKTMTKTFKKYVYFTPKAVFYPSFTFDVKKSYSLGYKTLESVLKIVLNFLKGS